MPYCTNCGNEVKEDANFCTNCGNQLKEGSQSSDDVSFLKRNRKLFTITGVVLAILLIAFFVINRTNQDGMILVEAGTTAANNGSVTVDNNFYISKNHVTQAEFEEVMGFNPSILTEENVENLESLKHFDSLEGNSDNRPVEMVTWYDAVMYCNKLSESEGLDKYYNIYDIEYLGDDAKEWEHPKNIVDAKVTENEGANGYRLPTEKEYEYAARGGKNGNATTYAGSDNLDKVGWYWKNSGDKRLDGEWDWEKIDNNEGVTHPVGKKEANELGLYDMSGNVWCWTNTSSDSNRIGCGGSWVSRAEDCEVDVSDAFDPSIMYDDIGFRLVRTK